MTTSRRACRPAWSLPFPPSKPELSVESAGCIERRVAGLRRFQSTRLIIDIPAAAAWADPVQLVALLPEASGVSSGANPSTRRCSFFNKASRLYACNHRHVKRPRSG